MAFPAMFMVLKKKDIFDKNSGHLQPCLWQKKQVFFHETYYDFQAVIMVLETSTLSQIVIVASGPKPNQSIGRVLWRKGNRNLNLKKC